MGRRSQGSIGRRALVLRGGCVKRFLAWLLAIVLGSSAEYTIAEVADRNAGIAAKIRKDRLNFK